MSDDCISRQAVLNLAKKGTLISNGNYESVCKAINELPSVTPQEPCEDAISRDAALEKMADYVASGYADSVEDFEEYSRIICQLPPVNPQPKTGHWITEENEEMETIGYYCSECDLPMETKEKTKFCPNCGSYNGGDNNGNE